jgi:hypothetical protein
VLKIRIVGTPEEAAQAAKALAGVFDVLESDGPKDRRGGSKLVSYYVTAELNGSSSAGPPQQKTAPPARCGNTSSAARPPRRGNLLNEPSP